MLKLYHVRGGLSSTASGTSSVLTAAALLLGLTLALTWALEFLAAAGAGSIPPWAVTTLRYAGGLMPLAVAAALVLLEHDRSFQRDYWPRLVDWRRIGIGWYAVILLYTPVNSFLAALIDPLLGDGGIAPEAVRRLAAQPPSIAPVLLFWLLFGPLPEEPGWRSYALDGLQARPSALAAIPFHFVGNAFGELFALSARAEAYSFILAVGAVLAVFIVWGPSTLAPGKTVARPTISGTGD
jgi:membrane protease YdiL (CAAX protease family)